MIDLHCHLLPAVDDGPPDLAQALALAKKLFEIGYHTVCATPHLPWGELRLSADQIRLRCEELSSRLRGDGIDLRIIPAAEQASSLVPDLLTDGRLVCYPRGDSFLMEFPLTGLPPRYLEMLFRAQIKGKMPVIAHAERYPEVQKDPALASAFQKHGARILVNLSSLAGAWGRRMQLAAVALVQAGLVDAVTTDLHSAPEGDAILAGLEMLRSLVDAPQLERLTVANPIQIAGLAALESRDP